jgi:hypothetical protein
MGMVYINYIILTFIHRCMHTQVTFGRGIPSKPHVIVLDAALDSRDEDEFPENLPLCPWY